MNRRWFCSALVAAAVTGGAWSPGKSKSPGRITEVSLERTPCFGTCPIDSLLLRADGRATYVGKAYVDRTGSFTGHFSEFDRLSSLLLELGFFELKNHYSVGWTDLPSVITSAVCDGKRKVVENYGDAGPLDLWAIEAAVRGAAADIKWQKDEAHS